VKGTWSNLTYLSLHIYQKINSSRINYYNYSSFKYQLLHHIDSDNTFYLTIFIMICNYNISSIFNMSKRCAYFWQCILSTMRVQVLTAQKEVIPNSCYYSIARFNIGF
jgi:hypothetical protein